MGLPRPSIKSPRSLHSAAHRGVDALCILLAVYVASGFGREMSDTFWVVGLAGVVCYFVAAEFTSLYRDWRSTSIDGELLVSFWTWSTTAVMMLVMGYITRLSLEFPRSSMITWAVLTPFALATSRIGLRYVQWRLLSMGVATRKFAVIGTNELGIQLAHNINNTPSLGLEFVGFYDDRSDDRMPEIPDDLEARQGTLDELVEQARRGEIHNVYIAFPMRAEDRIRDVLTELGDTTASAYIVPDFFVFELLHSQWSNVGGLPVVSVFENPLHGVDGAVKRVFDFVMAVLLLIALSPVMLTVALLVKLTSAGPVFFRQKRYGLDGKEILVWKFRSMSVCENGAKVDQATRNDPRVTRVGAFIRKTSLDELPQLFNVLGGSMSLVGPRPHATAHNEQFRKLVQGYMLRHKVKPGITGLAQVSGSRGETDTVDKMEQRVEFDHRYIREWSLWLDMKILFRTFFVVLSRQDAY